MTELSDRDLARVLDRAGMGAASDPTRKSQIRAEVLREFDQSVAETEAADESELFLTLASTSEPPTGRGTMALAAAEDGVPAPAPPPGRRAAWSPHPSPRC